MVDGGASSNSPQVNSTGAAMRARLDAQSQVRRLPDQGWYPLPAIISRTREKAVRPERLEPAPAGSYDLTQKSA